MRKMKQRRWTAPVAEAELSQWAESGLSMRAFSAKRGYPVQRLTWWRSRLGHVAEGKKVQRPQGSPGKLVEATITGLAGGWAAVVIDVGPGIRIEVSSPERVSPSWVADMVSELKPRRS